MRRNYYNRQKYQNKSKNHFFSLKRRIFMILALLFFLGIFYLFFLSSVFQIKDIEIHGNKKISAEEINAEINNYINRPFLLFWKARNISLFNSAIMSQSLSDKYLFINNARITKKYFDKIDIEINERKIFAVWCELTKINKDFSENIFSEENEKDDEKKEEIIVKEKKEKIAEEEYEIKNCYYMDENGIIFDEAPESIGSLILTIQEISDREVALGEKVIDGKILDSATKIKKLLEKSNLEITKLFIEERASKDIEATVSEGWKIYINIERDIDEQINILDKALKEKISSKERMSLEYIDLRILDRVYYK